MGGGFVKSGFEIIIMFFFYNKICCENSSRIIIYQIPCHWFVILDMLYLYFCQLTMVPDLWVLIPVGLILYVFMFYRKLIFVRIIFL